MSEVGFLGEFFATIARREGLLPPAAAVGVFCSANGKLALHYLLMRGDSPTSVNDINLASRSVLVVLITDPLFTFADLHCFPIEHSSTREWGFLTGDFADRTPTDVFRKFGS